MSTEPAGRLSARLAHAERSGTLMTVGDVEAIVTLATLFGKRGGSVCSVADNIATGEKFKAGAGHAAAMEVASEGVAILAGMDRAKKRANADQWLPHMGME